MDADPVGQRLAEAGLGVGVVRRPENGDEDLSGAGFPRQAIEHRHGVASEVHEQLLARGMGLAHGRRHAATPLAVQIDNIGCSRTRPDAGRDSPATAAPASRRGDAARHGHRPSPAGASIAAGYSPLARTACVPAPHHRARPGPAR